MRLALFLLVICPILASPLPAWADEAHPSPMPAPEHKTLEQFGAANTACREWTDGCAVCLRKDAAAFDCSLPGIACLPEAISCRPSPDKRTPDAPKAEAPH